MLKNYYDILRDLREDNDKTQAEIAAVLGMKPQQYSRYERGERELPLKHLITLCNYYKISSDYILGIRL